MHEKNQDVVQSVQNHNSSENVVIPGGRSEESRTEATHENWREQKASIAKHVQEQIKSSSNVGVEESIEFAQFGSKLLDLQLIQAKNASEQDGKTIHQHLSRTNNVTDDTKGIENQGGKAENHVNPAQLGKGFSNILVHDRGHRLLKGSPTHKQTTRMRQTWGSSI